MVRDALTLLGLPPDEPATPEQTKRAYLRKLREHPPESDPGGFQEVRAAYELVKDGYAPLTDVHDLEEETAGEPVELTADRTADANRQIQAQLHAWRREPDERAQRASAILDAAFAHLERLDLRGARAVVEANPLEAGRKIDRALVMRYVGLRELLEGASKLPETAVSAFARALRAFEQGVPSTALLAYQDVHPRDARHAFQFIRRSETTVLRPLVCLIEPPRRLAIADRDLVQWILVAAILLSALHRWLG